MIKLEGCLEGAGTEPHAVDNAILTLATRGHSKTTWLPESWGKACGWTRKSAKLGLLCFSGQHLPMAAVPWVSSLGPACLTQIPVNLPSQIK